MAYFIDKGPCLRYERNPILTIADIPFDCNAVFNAGATKFNGQYLLLLRVELNNGKSILVPARSADGYKFEVSKKTIFGISKKEPFKTFEGRGLEDPRITKIGNTYYIMYTAYSSQGPRLALAMTKDFVKFERLGIVSGSDNKNGALFPEKINGRYVRLDRPVQNGEPNIWISYSKDLLDWSDTKLLMRYRPEYWDAVRIGAGAPPFKTEKGWLAIYHGVKMTAAGPIYRLGAFLLDLQQPEKILGRTEDYILSPYNDYERIGDVPNVVFTCGAVMELNGEIKIYYGAADTQMCLALADRDELIKLCLKGKKSI